MKNPFEVHEDGSVTARVMSLVGHATLYGILAMTWILDKSGVFQNKKARK